MNSARSGQLIRSAVQSRGVAVESTAAAMVAAAKIQGAGLAAIGLAGAGAGIGTVFGALIQVCLHYHCSSLFIIIGHVLINRLFFSPGCRPQPQPPGSALPVCRSWFRSVRGHRSFRPHDFLPPPLRCVNGVSLSYYLSTPCIHRVSFDFVLFSIPMPSLDCFFRIGNRLSGLIEVGMGLSLYHRSI